MKYYLQLVFALFGSGTSFYLLVQHTRLKSGIQGEATLCNLGQYANCNVVNASAQSEIFGIPLAALGVLFFAALFIFGLIHQPQSRGFGRSQVWMARACLLALTFDLYLFGVQLFAIRSFCLFCLFTYVCTIGHLVLNWMQVEPGQGRWRRFVNGERKVKIASFAWSISLVTLLVVTVGLYQYVHGTVGSARTANLESSRKAFLETWKQRPSKSFQIGAGDPVWGNPKSSVQIVVFSDFECPHCQRGAFALQTALSADSQRVQMIFKNFPLDNKCNPLLRAPMHANACALAYLGYCASQKNRFWDFHDRVFFKLSAREISSSQDQLYEGVKTLFTRKEFDACLANENAKAKILDDIELGKKSGVDSTPSIFINGKRVIFSPTVDLLRELVQKEFE